MMINLKRVVVGIRWLSGPNPDPIPTFAPATRARIQDIFDRAARRKLRESAGQRICNSKRKHRRAKA
jgi:hypothetical protein